MEWTSKQLEAIEHDGENILVSAGAGSGKTAILTERVIHKLKKGININQLLILTFTKAASEEMKARIRKNIIANHLTEQLNLLDSSYITTFDSYALSIVKKYHYLLNLNKDVTLVDESILKIERSKIIESVLEKYYQNKESDFLLLIKTFVKKDDNNLKEAIEDILNKIELEIDTDAYLKTLEETNLDLKYPRALENYLKKIYRYLEEIENLLFNMENLIENESDEKFVSKCKNYYSTLLNSKNYNQIKNFLNNGERLNVSSNNVNIEIASNKKEITEIVNKIKKLAIYDDETFIKENYYLSHKLSLTLLKIVKEVYTTYINFKLDKQMFTFIDIAKFAIKIFKEHPEICHEIANNLQEIMIDEYQDTSSMQEIFMSYISNNNMYMVGDIKQSIYRFRYANPDLFKEKYAKYKVHDGGYLIDLNTNFRSRKEVLANINEIFSLIMSDELGGANYKKEHLIEYGNLEYLKDNITNQDHNLVVYSYNWHDFKPLSVSEIEAFIIANDIKTKINNHYLVYDKHNHLKREAIYSDFTILVDKRSDFATYKKVFESFNLPVNLYQNENLVGVDDLYCFNSILIVINGYFHNDYDTKFKHAYYSLAKSYLFSLTDEEILETIVNSNYKESIIYTKLLPIIEKIDLLSIKDLFREIIFVLDWYNKLILKGEVRSSEARLAYLLTLASNLDKLGYDLNEVIEYFKIIMDKELEISLPLNKSDANAIKFMTIHNSKGLQFPLCYFIGFSNPFNIDEVKDDFILDKDELILPFVVNNIKYHNLEYYTYKDNYLREEISEKIRLLYVALTRSEEKMTILTPLAGKQKPLNESSNFNDFMNYIKDEMFKYYKDVINEDIEINYNYQLYKPNKQLTNNLLPFTYKRVKNEKTLIETNRYSKNLSLDKENNKILQQGTKIHNLLFELDFLHPNYQNIAKDDKFIIERFLNQEFLNLDKALNIYKEYEFIDNEQKGIIDLIIEYDNEIKIIDYKLSNIDDPNYNNQLKGYKNYLAKIVNKPINLYLYSLFKGIYKKID